jgi:hypothetical protein
MALSASMTPKSNRWWYVLPTIAMLVALPCLLANDPAGTLIGFLLFLVVIAFPADVALSLLDGGSRRYPMAITFVFGIGLVTTTYDVFARTGADILFAYCATAISIAEVVLLLQSTIWRSTRRDAVNFSSETTLAGAATAISIAPLFWASGRFANGVVTFYGPAGQSEFMHVTLLERLLHHVPPDNFMFAGLVSPFYHYFSDQLLALILRTKYALHLDAVTLFDVCLRCYPAILYFLLGALSYRAGRIMLGSVRGGILSVLLLLGAGGLTWIFGLMQIAVHVPDPIGMRLALFPEWTAWDGIGSIRSLVSRPAHFNGLLFCLAAINVLLRTGRTRLDWIVAGLLLGLMAGFNYTLAVTLGGAGLFACVALLLLRSYSEASDLAWLTVAMFVGALPTNLIMISVGLHHIVPGAGLSGPTLNLPVSIWGDLLNHFVPSTVLPLACLILFPIVAYGVRLFGLRALLRGEIAGLSHRGLGIMFAAAFVLSFMIGVFYTFQAIGGAPAEKTLLQPTLWILGIFSLQPILSWLERGRRALRAIVLWGMLALTWVQSLAAFHFTQKVAFSANTEALFRDIRSASSPDDVIVYLPVDRVGTPILGEPQKFADFAVTAMTGLDGYFSNETYSVSYALSGLHGSTATEVLAAAGALYRQRMGDVEAYLQGDADSAALARLNRDNVRWIVLSEGSPRELAPALKPWRQNPEVVVYKLPVE